MAFHNLLHSCTSVFLSEPIPIQESNPSTPTSTYSSVKYLSLFFSVYDCLITAAIKAN